MGSFLTEKNKLNIGILTISTSAYIFSYLFVLFVYQFTTSFMAAQYHVRTILYLDKISFITQDNSPFWYSDSVLSVFFASPIVSLFFIFTLIWLYHKFIDDESIIKHFFLWGAIHFINRLLGTFIIGTIFYLYESNLIADWLYLGMETKILIVSLTFILMIVIGRFTAFPLLASADSPTLLKENNRKNFIIHQVYLPWVIGSIFLFLIQLPKIPINNNLLHISILCLIVPLFFRYNKFLLPSFDGPEVQYKIPWRFISFLMILIVIMKIFLNRGIQFGSESESSDGLLEISILIAIIIISLIIQMIFSYRRKKKSTRKLLEGF